MWTSLRGGTGTFAFSLQWAGLGAFLFFGLDRFAPLLSPFKQTSVLWGALGGHALRLGRLRWCMGTRTGILGNGYGRTSLIITLLTPPWWWEGISIALWHSVRRKGGRPFVFNPAAGDMGDFMNANGLVDPGFSGPAFTWTNNKDAGSQIFSRLDRFLISSSILDEFQGLKVKHLSRLTSDHCPILCSVSEAQSESLRYKVQLLKATLTRIMTWWGQHAKVRWIEEGDGNTRFFHNIAPARRRINLLDQLKHPDGRLVTDQSEIIRMVEEFFQNKWENNDIVDYGWPSLDLHFASMQRLGISHDCEITREEIWLAVKSMGKNRAPGRDGVTASFFKSFWDIVGVQVILACLEFFSSGRMEPEWKDTVVVLLPKGNNADHPSKFRPISLCQTIYKVIAKILVNRIKGILPSIVSEEQAAFVPGRSISDHCLLGQEIMNMFKVSKSAKGWLALKVDMEQAYDKMNWHTLEVVLMKMGFPQRFRSWVMSCVTVPRFTILVNGTLTEGITAGYGFRQGCPLSPYLFILCSKLLSLHFRQNYPELGVQIKVGRPAVSHVLYADDVLCFAGATIPNVRKLLKIFDDYCGWTGQRINKNKSAILFSRKVASSTKSRLARIAGCHKVTEMDYLGIKFALRRLTRADFSPLLQKIQSHIVAWGTRQLSLAGRITMINSVLLPLLVLAMTHMLVPRGVLADAERLCRSFLWDKDQNHKSLHYAAWGSLTRPRHLGGHGFHAINSWTGPLRARIAWDFIKKPQNFSKGV
ncbi:Putative ribonuclease H protein [Dendrobium catenatum]|uniref:Ribonuclease H protein n=1 Tax=Dendrobium catenatum TaxID=906689 RepID=A0A2I0VC08_9ASPA|nr:Putative ribonuclease H protein [Dendrobium catenatum]